MESEILKYALEQCGGVLIAVILIIRVERRLDKLTETLDSFRNALTEALGTVLKNREI